MQQCPIVNPDSIRLALHGKPFIPEAEQFVWAVAKCMVKALFIAGHETVVVDATNTTRKRRDEWKSSTWTRQYVEFERDPLLCKQRAQATARDAEHLVGLVAAIDRMNEQYEPVADDEKITRINK
jgi:predicted kinase